MILPSCANCWYDALQYGPVGTSVGYCVEHCLVLRQAHRTTCGRQRRLDLSWPSASAVADQHRTVFPEERVVELRWNGGSLTWAEGNGQLTDVASELLFGDAVAETVGDYGELGSKIESLAQLRRLEGARAELALLSLARGYVARCVSRGGLWTSGLHLFWWTVVRLADEPELDPARDFWLQTDASLARQVELAKWSQVMLRLSFLSDVIGYAKRQHPLADIGDLAERAAAETGAVSLRRLLAWVRRKGEKLVSDVLPEGEYRRLARELHLD